MAARLCRSLNSDSFVLIWTCAYRDVRLSSRLGLVLEALSLAVIVVITAIVVIKRGTILDPNQLQLQRLPLGRVTSALTLAVFSFVGFESSTTLAREARNPLHAIPRAVILSATISGVFFVATAYCMILAVNDRVNLIGGSTSPFAAVTQYAGLSSAAAVVYGSASISSFACMLACVNAVARMLFSMGRYQFIHSAMGRVHQRYQSPHVAVSAACVFSLTMVLLLAHTAPLDAFGYAATFGTFGFLTVYLLTLHRRAAGTVSCARAVAGGIGGRHYRRCVNGLCVGGERRYRIALPILATAVYFSRVPGARRYLVRSHFS